MSTTYDSPVENRVIQTENNKQTTADTPSSEPQQADVYSDQLDLDVFFDASDSSVVNTMQDSFLGLDHPTTGSNSTTWTDNLEIGDMTWSSSSIYSSIPESVMEFPVPTQNMEGVESQLPVFGEPPIPQDAFKAQNLHAVPEENFQQDQTVLMDSALLDQALSTFNASDDPFMGWASKRASHLFDDYGWVLSHVEAL